jgi:hypothetical protein
LRFVFLGIVDGFCKKANSPLQIDIVEWYGGLGHQQKSHPDLPISAAQSYHFGYGCGADAYNYNIDSTWWPSLEYNSTDPVVDFSADFHVFGVELNSTSIRFYTDNVTTSVRTLPELCVTDPGMNRLAH